ncbi:MAG TPA: hypothetical protein VLT47_05630 [Anaeromyxobacteraceae bacterium]|nr:hypothetical protein [Anaeromyxobacteraceae bacterium]
MLRWFIALPLLATLAPSPAIAEAGETETAPVRVLRRSSPYLRTRQAPFALPPRPAPMGPRIGRVVPFTPPVGAEPDLDAVARARACKIFDRNGDGVGGPDEPMVEGWRFRLASPERGAKVRTTGWDGCATFTGLHPGRYVLSEVLPPFWNSPPSEGQELEVKDPREQAEVVVMPTFSTGRCVHFAQMGSPEYWRGNEGLRLLDVHDQEFLNALAPYRAPSGSFRAGAEPFDGRFSNGVTRVRGLDGAGAWRAGTWEAELSHYLGDRGVGTDPRGRLAQEILVFALNARHFLENAEVVVIEDVPIFVDDLIFEGILAWRSNNPAWNHEMTALLAALNGARGLEYVPRDQCQVAYLPF